MPVEHMVWIKFKESVGDEEIDEHLAGLGTLSDCVPDITALRLGENFTNRAAGYQYGLIVTFKSRRALDQYLSHPEHVAVADPLKRDAELMVMDFEY